jgi:hypothetical protein
MSAAEETGTWQRQQSDRVSTHKPIKPAIPGNYGCAGECSAPPPPHPPGTEHFENPFPREWIVIIGVVTLGLFLVNVFSPKKRGA